MKGPFDWTSKGDSGSAPYLRLLNLSEGSDECLPQIRQTALEHPDAALALLDEDNWRPHVVAAVACYLGDVDGAVEALWSRLSKGSWAGPQLAAVLSLIDESFVSRALSMLEAPSLGTRPVLALLEEDLGGDERLGRVTFFDDLDRKGESDSHMKGRIALSFRAGLAELARDVFPDIGRFAVDASRTSRADALELGVRTEDLGKTTLYRFYDGQVPIQVGRAMELMRTSAHFRRCLSDSIYFSGLRGPARWELPPMSSATLEDPFEFVVVPEPGLMRPPDASSFKEHLRTKSKVVAFKNLSGSAQLVVPRPQQGRNYAHLVAFLHAAPWSSVHALWQRVGFEVELALSERPLWLSTAGLGVPWLHVRIDKRPKYYKHAPYRDASYRP